MCSTGEMPIDIFSLLVAGAQVRCQLMLVALGDPDAP